MFEEQKEVDRLLEATTFWITPFIEPICLGSANGPPSTVEGSEETIQTRAMISLCVVT